MNLFKTHIQSIVLEDFILLNPECQINSIPSIESVILSAKFADDAKSAICVLDLLAFSRPSLTKNKTTNLSLKLKKGEVVGCILVLRKKPMYTFLERFVFEILPSQKSLKGLKEAKNSIHWHFSDVFVLDDISNHYMYLQGLRSLDVLVITKKANTKFYQALRFPLKK